MRNFLDIQEATVESKHWGDETPTYTELGLERIYMEIQLQQAGTDSVARDVLVAQTAAACAVDLKALEAI